MRPDRFQTLMTNALPSVPGITKAETFADTGHDRSPYGLVLHHANGARTFWQVVATSRTGDNYAQPEGQPVTGERQAELPIPDLTGDRVATSDIEAAITGAFTRADTAGEAARVERYSEREAPGAITRGLTIDFHDTSRIYVYGLASLRQGETQVRENRAFQVDATV